MTVRRDGALGLWRHGDGWASGLRAGRTAAPVGDVLFGPGSVHGLDDEPYHWHKARYLRLLTPPQDLTADLARIPARPHSGVLVTGAP